MLWSLIKILAFVAIVTALTYGGTQLMEVDGGATISVMGFEFTLSPLEMVFAFVAFVVAVWLGLKLLALCVATFKFLNGDETAISRYFDRNRERKGYEALSEGMMALASGEGHLAMTKAARADKYLQQPQLTNLLTAQAAEMTGDRRKAEETYKKLLSDDKTRFVGVRGIMKQKLSDGDTDTALALAQKAFALKPKHEETQDVLLRLQAEKSDWAGARKTLSAKLKSGGLPRDVHKRRDAVLALSEARDVLEDGKSIEARETAIEANRLSPDLIPAAVMAARSYIGEGNARYATRVLTKAWNAQPHPDIAAAFAEIAPDENAEARLKRFRTLTKPTADHPETKMLMAELYISAEDFPAAKRVLGDLVETDPSARSLTLMAAIERGEGADDSVVRGWLTRALTAPRGPQWICDNCQHIQAGWAATCSNCGSFDTLAWRKPPEGDVAMPAGTEMLPLIVGAPTQNVVTMPEDVMEDAEILATDPEPIDQTGVSQAEK
ncbi:heme biosynthesis HemY N-terminal domain-containing protein [Cognatiyoonia sp. IB215446]|uniref:heme biosynthesis protein HemY n=1 Tax=Cognatiyoonia sp. IB215446 TaxID=3097355 RepID=UPI002A1701BF|nr:heme biosynthesis HemY N-terminal domain-containing protein [Cognatiyoonia sp. IB215446]MDX8349313.1 heme biosynthesis HemY N-terminal domain-containing protein [Cognatiyoonia sp. IB215446]